MTLKHTLTAGVARAMFVQPLSAPLMLRGAVVPFSPEGEGDPAPAADPAPAPEADPAPAAADADPAPGDPDRAPAGDPDPADPEPKKPKSPVAQLQGRVGHLTKTIHQKDADLGDRDRRIAALEALLTAAGKTPEGEGAPAAEPARSSATPAPGTPEFQALVQTEAQKVAAQQAFDRDCNTILDTGEAKFGAEFKTGVESLNALGIMSIPLVQAAMATGAAPEVIHALGNDTEEAERISNLPPAQMGVELAKLAGKLQVRDPKQVSKAPPPITPVGSAVKPEVDIADPNLPMSEYVARRKQMGAKYAR